MGLVSEAAQSSGDVMRRLRQLEKQVRALQTARRLESASIGRGGLSVRGGAIVIFDQHGTERMRLSTDGLTLEGLLEVLGGIDARSTGKFRYIDADGYTRVVMGATGDQEVNLSYLSPDTDNPEVVIGAIYADEKVAGHGLLIQDEQGRDMAMLTSGGTRGWRMDLRSVHGIALQVLEDGLALPRLPVQFVPGFVGSDISDGDGLRTVSEGYPVNTFPQMRLVYRVTVRSGSPTVRVRVRDTAENLVLSGFETHSEGGYSTRTFGIGHIGWLMRNLVRVEAEVTAGAGTATVTVVGAWVGDFA